MSKNELTPRKAAQQLGVRLDVVYALLWAEKLSARKQDGRWYIPASAVEHWLKARAQRKVAKA